MKRSMILLVALVAALFASYAQTPSESALAGHEGPYVLHGGDGSVRVVSMEDGAVSDVTYPSLPEGFLLKVCSNEGHSFEVTLHGPVGHRFRQENTNGVGILVMSDLHGRFDAFIALLRGNGVIDEGFRWSFGKGKLVFIGDALDRGRDDTAIVWLLYKLEAEADAMGGEVIFMPGNHEDLVLKNDIRYVNKAHLDFAEEAGVPYAELWGKNSELGRWVRSRNLAVRIDTDLFVHAGLSHDMVNEGYSLDEMSGLSREYLGIPNKERNGMYSRNLLLFGNSGPVWYRGMVYDKENYNPITHGQLSEVLDYYASGRVFVGHSEVDEIESRYDGRVIAVNVRHYDNFPANRTGAVLIEGGRLYAVDYRGNRRPID